MYLLRFLQLFRRCILHCDLRLCLVLQVFQLRPLHCDFQLCLKQLLCLLLLVLTGFPGTLLRVWVRMAGYRYR